MSQRIDSLAIGTGVILDFNGQYTESALFGGIVGTGDDRKAVFYSVRQHDGNCYDWQAYRYNGRWAYGSSAGRLTLVSVNDTTF